MTEPAGADEALALAALHRAAFARPWSEQEIAGLMLNPAVFTLKAAEAGVVAGFIMAMAAGEEAEILTLAVAPPARRAGHGAALVAAAAAVAHARGAAALLLEVAEDNQAARALYAGFGFHEAGRRVAYYSRDGGSADALVLKRILPLAED